MKTVCEKYSCTGCGLCASLCPVSCITMKQGEMGHVYPSIDHKRCIDCGRCKKNCPVLSPIEKRVPQHAYAAWAKDDSDYRSSTSGGASSVFSQYVILQGGVVYGCAVLSGAVIEHVRIDKAEELYKIKGSKYVQSSILGVLPQIKKDVEKKRKVLFIGTPCQTAAVGKLFKSPPDNLILVDLVCHGTPSQYSFQHYLKRHVPLPDVDNVSFRSDEGYVIKVFSGGEIVYASPELRSNRYKDYYYNAFMDGYSYRKSCYQCRYAVSQRGSDITIGDFWGLGDEISCEEIPEHRYGISLVLPITEKGESLFNKVSSSLNVYERPISEALNGNDQLKHPKEKTKEVRVYRFFQPFLGDKYAYQFVIALLKTYSWIRRILLK